MLVLQEGFFSFPPFLRLIFLITVSQGSGALNPTKSVLKDHEDLQNREFVYFFTEHSLSRKYYLIDQRTRKFVDFPGLDSTSLNLSNPELFSTQMTIIIT